MQLGFCICLDYINSWINWGLASRKGFGECSPNTNREVCGEQAESQGKQSIAVLTGGDMLVKIEEKLQCERT